MAIGMDYSLAPPKRPPAPTAPPTSKGAAPSYGQQPPAISDRVTQGLANNLAASSFGAGQLARNAMDRAGMSRGKGQEYYGDVAQAQADVKAQSASVGAEMEASAANAKARADYENTMKAERAANDGLLESLRGSAAAERFAKLGFGQDIYEAIARGQFGLNSMNLDPTSLLRALMRG